MTRLVISSKGEGEGEKKVIRDIATYFQQQSLNSKHNLFAEKSKSPLWLTSQQTLPKNKILKQSCSNYEFFKQ